MLSGDRFSATFSVLTAEKHAWKIRGKFGEKVFFASFFCSVFRFSLATPYFEQLFTFKPKNFAQSPLCEKYPLIFCMSPENAKVFQPNDGQGHWNGHQTQFVKTPSVMFQMGVEGEVLK